MVNDFVIEWRNASPQVRLQTSGSTGAPKVFFADKERLRASARMTCDFLGLHEGQTALLCLSCDYIAGKMMVVRALERGLRLVEVAPSGRPLEALAREHPDITEIDLCAMVPSQVYCSIDHPLFSRIRHLIVGGGPIPPALEQRLRTQPVAVWSSYGMTETLSHIALRRVSGAEAEDWYRPLPGVALSLSTLALLLTASQGVSALCRGLNAAYGVREERSGLVVAAISVGVAFVVGTLIAATVYLVFGSALMRAAATVAPSLEPQAGNTDIVSLVISVAVGIVLLDICYTFLPSGSRPLVRQLPGAAIASVLCGALTQGFRVYVDHFCNFDALYGSLSTVALFLFWMFIASFILIACAFLNRTIFCPAAKSAASEQDVH
jgi:YihY family inner membrane protein